MSRTAVRRLPLRLRLTLVYAGLFLAGGAVLLGATYLLVAHNLDIGARVQGSFSDLAAQRADQIPDDAPFTLPDGTVVTAAEVTEAVRADQERFEAEVLSSVLTRGGIALGVTTVFAAGLGWLVAGRALRPLDRITDTAARIARTAGAGRGLHERLDQHGPDDEVQRLADTFDDMLGSLDRAFDGQRRFVANASHELRTPLALNRALAELAMTRPGAPDDTVQLARSLLTVNARHERLIDGLLTLAESETAVTDRTGVDFAEVAGAVLAAAAPVAEAAGVAVRQDLVAAPTLGDPVLLERLVQNLVENAVRHNSSGGWLEVRTGCEGASAVVTVTNTGPTVPTYETETIFQPFRRLEPRTPGPDRGFGLGLSIVRGIALAHGGEVTARPRAGGGLVVTVALPGSP